MELTKWESFVLFLWGEFCIDRYLAYTKRIEMGMAKRPAYRYTAKSTKAEINKFLNNENK